MKIKRIELEKYFHIVLSGNSVAAVARRHAVAAAAAAVA